jgi:hypothetical protein
VLGLPDSAAGCLFYLHRVLTQTAKIHAAVWNAVRRVPAHARGGRQRRLRAVNPVADYSQYVDGRPRCVDRVGQADALRANGANVVVGGLAELL